MFLDPGLLASIHAVSARWVNPSSSLKIKDSCELQRTSQFLGLSGFPVNSGHNSGNTVPLEIER